MTVRHIVAIDACGGISRGGETPWFLPQELADMRRKMELFGGIVLVGSHTWEIMEANARKNNPLQPDFGGRHIHVVSSRQLEVPDYVTLVPDLNEFEKRMERENNDFWVASGTLYPVIKPDEVYLTRIEHDFDCDQTYSLSPELQLAERSDKQTENGVDYYYEIYRRVS